MQGPLAAGGARRGAAKRLPIPLPAPLASGLLPAPHPSRVVDLPRLRWAARCHDRQFDGGNVALHAHDEPELVFSTRGRTSIVVDGLRLEARPGDLYVLPPGRPHALFGAGAWENVCVLYAGGDAIVDAAPRTIAIGTRHRLRRWLLDLAALYDRRPETPGAAADALLLAILADIAEIERRSDSIRSFHPRLAAAVDYLHAHAAGPVSAAGLALATGTSYSHLGALFRARFGCGPLDYHRRRRLDRARNLLLDPHLSVAAVAARLGFDDVSYFVRTFRKAYGVPPHRWRRDAGRRQ
jgi:AraC-like DNA-binding protein/mannose-6-phosphate isomerase-like protein (cupin superfamily)